MTSCSPVKQLFPMKRDNQKRLDHRIRSLVSGCISVQSFQWVWPDTKPGIVKVTFQLRIKCSILEHLNIHPNTATLDHNNCWEPEEVHSVLHTYMLLLSYHASLMSQCNVLNGKLCSRYAYMTSKFLISHCCWQGGKNKQRWFLFLPFVCSICQCLTYDVQNSGLH